ncbi:hypothetical protein ACSF86_01170 [Moraxella bovoculi]|uniref:hypothetical protein n=1 Tax=Moraxella bovoculi TaxID=386891 RepID=UPI003F505CF9
MKVAVKVEGLKELDRALGELKEDMRGKALYSALHFAANSMLKEAKARAEQAAEPHQMQYGGNTVTVKPGLLKSSLKKRRLTKKEHAQGMCSAAIGIVISKKIRKSCILGTGILSKEAPKKCQPHPFSALPLITTKTRRWSDLRLNLPKKSKSTLTRLDFWVSIGYFMLHICLYSRSAR